MAESEYRVMSWSMNSFCFLYYFPAIIMYALCTNPHNTTHHDVLIDATPRQISPISLFLLRLAFNSATLAIRLMRRSSRDFFFTSFILLFALIPCVFTAFRRIPPNCCCISLCRLSRCFVDNFHFCRARFLLPLAIFTSSSLLLLRCVDIASPCQQSGKSGNPGTPLPAIFSLLPQRLLPCSWPLIETSPMELLYSAR